MSGKNNATDARGLSAALDRPIFNRALGKEVGNGDLDYEVYLQTSALYGLQTKRADLTVPDEHLFQVMHQSQELWLKAVAFEVVALVTALGQAHLHQACAVLDRIVVIQQSLAGEMRILQTLTPDTFQAIRRNLGNGSGLESPGYNRVLVAAAAAEACFDAVLEQRGVTLLDLYRRLSHHDEAREGLKRVAELLVDWDEAFQAWLVSHFMLVRRTIGVSRKTRALDGFPTQALAPRMTKPLFPKLWDARIEMTEAWEREGGHAPGASRQAADSRSVPPPRTSELPQPRATERPSAPDTPLEP